MRRSTGWVVVHLALFSLLWGPSTACRPHKIHPVAVKAQNSCAMSVTQNRLEVAEQQGRLALRYNPRYAQAYNCLAMVAIRKGHMSKAERLLKKALTINSNFADARSNLGYIFYTRKNYKRARYLFRTALDIDPQLLYAGYNMARTLVILRQYKRARAQIIQSIFFKKNRQFPGFHYLLGFIEFERKNYKGAVRHLIDTVRLDPNHTNAHLTMCKALYQLSQFSVACYHCKQVLRIKPGHVDGRNSLAAVGQMLQKHGKRCYQRR